MNNIRQRTLSGLKWSGATRFLGKVSGLGISVILARLLGPRDFGLIGMVLVFTEFASIFSDMGLGASLVQQQTVSQRHLNSVFWLNVVAGTLLAILCCLIAPLIANFYKEPVLRLITFALAVNFFLRSLNVVQKALLVRSLNFHTIFRIEIISLVVSGIAALVLAYMGAGVWSLVGQSVFSTAVSVAVMWGLSSWRPTMSFDLSAVRDLMRFGANLTGSGIVNYWGRSFDKLVVGRFLGSPALGIYSLADRLRSLPLTLVTDIAGSVMFPALSIIRDDIESVKRAYLRATRMIALLSFPMMIGLSILAEPAILAVYGDKWQEAIKLLQVLSFAGMAHSVYFTGGWIFLSRGRTDLLLRWNIYATLVRVVGFLVGIRWGIIGVAYAYLFCSYVFICYPTWSSAGRLIDLGMKDLLSNLSGPFFCAVLMGAVLWVSDRWLFHGQSIWMRLVAQGLSGVLLYGFLIRQFQLKTWEEVRRIILEMIGGRSRVMRRL